MSDVGIDLLKPKYDKKLLVEADLAYWEAVYNDGSVLREVDGAKYPQIDRSRLDIFRIVWGGEIIFQTFAPPGGGRNLVYRRRTGVGAGGAGRTVWFIVGWAPHGPICEVDLAARTVREDTAGLLASLTPMPGEPDDILILK